MKKLHSVILILSLLASHGCSNPSAEGETPKNKWTYSSSKSAPNSHIVEKYLPDIEVKCEESSEEQKIYLSKIATENHPSHDQPIYWAGVSYCAYISKDFKNYKQYLDMLISSSINSPKSNAISELVFSFTDNGRYEHHKVCSIAAISKKLAVEYNDDGLSIKPFQRYGEVKTLNNFMCNTLDVEGLKRIKK